MSDELKACPFCNAVLAEDKAGTRYFTHPKSDCILSQIEFDMDGAPEMVMQWNRRAQPAEEVQKTGEVGRMPGTDGFTMACFRAAEVPIGTTLYVRRPTAKETP